MKSLVRLHRSAGWPGSTLVAKAIINFGSSRIRVKVNMIIPEHIKWYKQCLLKIDPKKLIKSFENMLTFILNQYKMVSISNYMY